jgi:hypothetical protein
VGLLFVLRHLEMCLFFLAPSLVVRLGGMERFDDSGRGDSLVKTRLRTGAEGYSMYALSKVDKLPSFVRW